MNKKKNTNAVSEILGSMLLLLIVICVISTIFYYVLSDEGPAPAIVVKIIGKSEGKYILLDHNGGDNVDGDNEIIYTIGSKSSEIVKIGTLLNKTLDKEPIGVWNLGEQLKIPINFSIDTLDDFKIAEITMVDAHTNSIIFHGPITLPKPVSDLGIEISMENLGENPEDPIDKGDNLRINITLTCYGGSVNWSSGVIINYKIPNGLYYNGSFSPSGHKVYNEAYNHSTGEWNAGDVYVGKPASLIINITVGKIRETQLVFALDGSGSIDGSDWDMTLFGLSNAIKNESVFPHDGSVELSIVQFGIGKNNSINNATIELNPTRVSSLQNATNIANNILNITQGNGWTPMAAGLYLSNDTLKKSTNYSIDQRHVICMITDGKPTCWSNKDEFFGRNCGSNEYKSMISTEVARNHILSQLQMTEGKDEFDVLAVGTGPDVSWLNSSIVWPNPYIWDIQNEQASNPGWVAHIDSYEQFEYAITEMLKAILKIHNTVNYVDSITFDPNESNNQADIIIE